MYLLRIKAYETYDCTKSKHFVTPSRDNFMDRISDLCTSLEYEACVKYVCVGATLLKRLK